MSDANVSFTLVLFNDESVKKKLTVMNPMECMFDDERNIVPDEYWEIVEGLKPGDKIEIMVHKF